MPESARASDQHIIQLLDAPSYSLAEASRLVGISTGRVRRWQRGYEYRYEIVRGAKSRYGSQEPVVRRETTEGTTYSSFLDLIDLLFVRRFLDQGLSLQKVRKALDEAAQILGTVHFARDIFFTDGSAIFLQMRGKGENILQLMSRGQWVIPSIIVALAERIDFHDVTGYAMRWYPLGRDGLIVVDPMISFGRPSLEGRGTATANIYDLYRGEGSSIKPVAEWLDITQREAKAAVDFEMQLAA